MKYKEKRQCNEVMHFRHCKYEHMVYEMLKSANVFPEYIALNAVVLFILNIILQHFKKYQIFSRIIQLIHKV